MKRKQVPVILLIYLLIFYLLAYALEEKIQQYKVEVKEKLLYVLALDKDGNPVTNLKKDDFELYVDGQHQQIETFSLITHTANEPKVEKREVISEKSNSSNISVKKPKVQKRFILAAIPFIFNSYFEKWRTEKALKHLVEKSIYPNDWIGIVVIHKEWISALQDFTNSKEKLLKKIDAYFNLNKKKFDNLKIKYPLTNNEISQVPQLPIFKGTMPVIAEVDIIPSLELVGEKMRALEGRKVILCFGLDLCFVADIEQPLIIGEKYYNRIDRFYEMIDKLLSHNITIYYTELKKPHIPDFYPASSSVKLDSYDLLPGNPLLSPGGVIRGKLDNLRFYRESSHFALANETGGKYYYNISSPTYFIDDVNKINSSYYLISFPITIQINKKKSFSIKLKCRREGVKLYYSNKYYAPHELEEKKFEDTYKRIQLYKYLVTDTYYPTLEMQGLWIPAPGDEEGLQVGFIDFYLPPELFQQQSPIIYQLGASYSTSQSRGIFFQREVEVSAPQKNRGYRARALVKFTGEGKFFRLVAMDSESGEYGRFDIDISKPLRKADFSDIILGNLVDKNIIHEFRDYSEARYNLKKDFYKLLSLDKKLIIPSANNTFSQGKKITFCLIHKIPEKESKRYKNVKVAAYLSLDKEGQITEITLPVRSKKVEKHYRQYYGTIDTSNLKAGKYRIEIDLRDANNSIIAATDAYFEIIE